MLNLIKRLKGHSKFKRLVALLSAEKCVQGTGLWGTSSRYLVASLLSEVRGYILFVTSQLEEAESAYDEISYLTGRKARFFPPWDDLAMEKEQLDPETLRNRLSVIQEISSRSRAREVIVAPISALMQGAISAGAQDYRMFEIKRGQNLKREDLIKVLARSGFERVFEIEVPGQFSVRGGIIDIFSQADDVPLRIELLGDTVESIRTFDVLDQISQTSIESCRFIALKRQEIMPPDPKNAVSLFNLLAESALVIFNEMSEIEKSAEDYKQLSSKSKCLFSFEDLFSESDRFKRLFLSVFEESIKCQMVHFDVKLLPAFRRDVAESFAELRRLREGCGRLILLCTNEGEKKRVTEMLNEYQPQLREKLDLVVGPLRAGFDFADIETVVVGYDDIFQRYYQRRLPRAMVPARPIDSFLELSKGDYVVHASHGIGRYRGLEVLKKDGREDEFLVIEFADRAKLYVPASGVHVVQKYVGGREVPPLDRIGAVSWSRRKAAVTRAVMDLAGELVSLEAQRSLHKGIVFPSYDNWQNEFEASFIFQETEDQFKAIEEVKCDMEAPKPMDRLLCGDVGYGKTEIAMRAAFKAAVAGYQTAVLVPTTVLAQQHFQTFKERMADYPVIIDVLSRFKTDAQQKKTLEALARGEIDIIIGTHRLVQKDVAFKNLGLLIIDEEQRFGVEHKEYIKRLKKLVDVLTLTATPIPRTLHMALLGMRDISSLNTPPQDRLSIYTEVREYDEELIREAILRELNRGGQVYYIHNRVYNIAEVAENIAKIVPEAKIGVIHGQMPESRMEETMVRFVRRQIDVLVATAIIENGVDIPNVNTIVIDDADMFGLADLHQLRGRVGRYKHRAYAYLLLPRQRPITEQGKKRLKAIEDFCRLGSGYAIAMRDLEIRGAGNILGREQSGHIASVGYEMYCQILENVIRMQKGEPVSEPASADIKLGITAYIPGTYIGDERGKLEMYRRLSMAGRLEEIEDIERRLIDRYGPLPVEVNNLLERSRIAILAKDYKITSIFNQDSFLVITGRAPHLLRRMFRRVKQEVRFVDEMTAHLMLPRRHLSDRELLRFLKKCLKK